MENTLHIEREIQWVHRLCESEWQHLFGKFNWTTKSSYTQYKFESGWIERFGFDLTIDRNGEEKIKNTNLIHLFKRPIGTTSVRLLFNPQEDWEVNVKRPIAMIVKSAEETSEVPLIDKNIFTFGPSFSKLCDVPIDSTTFLRYRIYRESFKAIFCQAEPYYLLEAEIKQWLEKSDLSTFFATIETICNILKDWDFGPLYAPRNIPKSFCLSPVDHKEVKKQIRWSL